MKLSTKSTYGLRAALSLALRYGQSPCKAAELAQANSIPKSYLEQILNKLGRAGLVVALRGAKGGYQLAKEPEKISVGDIVRAVEGQLQPILCCFPESQSEDCRQDGNCTNHEFCQQMEFKLESVLDNTSLADLARKAATAQDDSPNDRAACTGSAGTPL